MTPYKKSEGLKSGELTGYTIEHHCELESYSEEDLQLIENVFWLHQ